MLLIVRPRRLVWLGLAGFVALLHGCGGGGSSATAPGQPEPVPGPAAPPASAPASSPAGSNAISLLFMGNSHTLFNDVPAQVAAMVRAARPNREVRHDVAPGSMFLDERLRDGASQNLLRSQNWSAVVLQAQLYSSSGNFTYPTDAAEEWVRRARAASAMPVMFPEWPRQGIDETARIYELHLSIARATPACVPPIPQSFDIARVRHPQLVLHASDGNHSSPAGALLAAMVIAATITGASPATMPTLPQVPVDAATQALLRGAAEEAVTRYPPRAACPDAPV